MQLLILVQIIILLYSVILHEVAHGWMAYRLGDPTAKIQKRLTLNPIPHIDLVMTILLPATLLLARSPLLLGGAKPVPIDERNFKNPKKDIALTALAGPSTNFLIALISGGILKLMDIINLSPHLAILANILFWSVLINVILVVFNLLPIPPLDGYKVAGGLIPNKFIKYWFTLERFGFLILLPALLLLDSSLINSFRLIFNKLAGFLM